MIFLPKTARKVYLLIKKTNPIFAARLGVSLLPVHRLLSGFEG
jgi:hypothetical protein